MVENSFTHPKLPKTHLEFKHPRRMGWKCMTCFHGFFWGWKYEYMEHIKHPSKLRIPHPPELTCPLTRLLLGPSLLSEVMFNGLSTEKKNVRQIVLRCFELVQSHQKIPLILQSKHGGDKRTCTYDDFQVVFSNSRYRYVCTEQGPYLGRTAALIAIWTKLGRADILSSRMFQATLGSVAYGHVP